MRSHGAGESPGPPVAEVCTKLSWYGAWRTGSSWGEGEGSGCRSLLGGTLPTTHHPGSMRALVTPRQSSLSPPVSFTRLSPLRARTENPPSPATASRHESRRVPAPQTARASPGRQSEAALPSDGRPVGWRRSLTEAGGPGKLKGGLCAPAASILSYRGRTQLQALPSPQIKMGSKCKSRRKLQQCEAELPSISGTSVTLESPERFTWFFI